MCPLKQVAIEWETTGGWDVPRDPSERQKYEPVAPIYEPEQRRIRKIIAATNEKTFLSSG